MKICTEIENNFKIIYYNNETPQNHSEFKPQNIKLETSNYSAEA